MEYMKKTAEKHGLVCLLHEKPYKGVNGSGKHDNWSITTDTKENLLDPGATPNENAQFLLFLMAVICAVDKHQDLLRISVASAGNDHRLGGNEAPPAILSVFLGQNLSNMLDNLVEKVGDNKMTPEEKTALKLGIARIPDIMLDNTDRNRTSPFAFTGNRFEFRAAGSSANCAASMIVINAAMAHQLNEFKAQIDALVNGGMEQEEALYKVLKETIIASKNIRFEGDGYSDEWRAEALKRGLTNISHVPEAIMRFNDPQSRSVLIGENIFNENELTCRMEVELEKFTKKVQIESRIIGDLAINHIIPVATKYQSQLVDNVYKMKEILGAEGEALSASNINLIRRIANLVHKIESGVAEMIECRKVANRTCGQYEKAIAYHDTVAPKLEELRSYIDDLEEVVDDSLWPLPKYRELLFIR